MPSKRRPGTPLRSGWTTGACATAATQTAFEALHTRRFADPVTIQLPKGQTPSFALAESALGDGWAMAAITKDAGDDPDVTHGALIRATVRPCAAGITFHAGKGVGIVTKPGLPIPPGEPAINPVPRQMMTEAIELVALRLGVAPAASIEISVPGGEQLAAKTWNPRLGITGGISILGTTGIVRPFSCAAWIASIHRGIDVARADALAHVVGSTGNMSEAAARALYPLPDHAFLDMGDFVGGLLKYLRAHPIPKLTIAGGFAKMTKLAQGAVDLHSSRSQVDMARLADLAGRPDLADSNTAAEALSRAGRDLAQQVAKQGRLTVLAHLDDADVEVETLVVDRAGCLIARSPAG